MSKIKCKVIIINMVQDKIKEEAANTLKKAKNNRLILMGNNKEANNICSKVNNNNMLKAHRLMVNSNNMDKAHHLIVNNNSMGKVHHHMVNNSHMDKALHLMDMGKPQLGAMGILSQVAAIAHKDMVSNNNMEHLRSIKDMDNHKCISNIQDNNFKTWVANNQFMGNTDKIVHMFHSQRLIKIFSIIKFYNKSYRRWIVQIVLFSINLLRQFNVNIFMIQHMDHSLANMV